MATKKLQKTSTKATSQKVDFEPNKMAFAIAALAAVLLVLVGIIATSS